MAKKASELKPFLVTTAHRGVFFGYLTGDGELPKSLPSSLTIQKARNVVYWEKAIHGFLGLAASGPSSGCRIGPAVDELTIYNVTSVAKVSDAATKQWEAAPWS